MQEQTLQSFLARIVPGSALRDGVERILAARMGALIVFGDGPEVLSICSGGFHLDAEMTPQRLYELAKMDGAIVLNASGTRIAWANVHLVPDPLAPTTETGTRHRSAERVARSLCLVVVAVSEEMGSITCYLGTERLPLERPEALLARASHLFSILEALKERYELAHGALAPEAPDASIALVVQRAEMVLRLASDLRRVVDQLGEQGAILDVHYRELVDGLAEQERTVLERTTPGAFERVRALSSDEIHALGVVELALRPSPS